MRVLTIATAKGGTGKTATAGALAQAAVQSGKRCLAIDLDPQASLSEWQRADFRRPGIFDVIIDRADIEDAIQETAGGVHLIAASANLAGLKTGPGSGRRLDEKLYPIASQYDLIVIDTGPEAGEAQYNALFASDGLLIPLETDSNSLHGMYQILDIAAHIHKTNLTLKVLGTVIAKYDSRPKINRFLREAIKEKGKELGAPLLAEIRQGVAIREAMAMQVPLFEYAPNSKPAQDYKALFELIMQEV